MLQGSPLDLWHEPAFTDQEMMTIYLYTMHHEGHTKVKHIHRLASEWLRPWFPPRESFGLALEDPLNLRGGADH